VGERYHHASMTQTLQAISMLVGFLLPIPLLLWLDRPRPGTPPTERH